MRIYFDDEGFDYVEDDFTVHTTSVALEHELGTAFMLIVEYRELLYHDKNIHHYELSEDQQELHFYTQLKHEGKHWSHLPEDMTIQELSDYCDSNDLRIAYDGTLQREAEVGKCVWVSDAHILPVDDIVDMLAYIKQHARTQRDEIVLSKLREALF